MRQRLSALPAGAGRGDGPQGRGFSWPASASTTPGWPDDAHNLMRFLSLRMANDAELDIYAWAI